MTFFDAHSDYKKQFAVETKKLMDLEIEDRSIRMVKVEELINDYIRDIGEKPPTVQIFKLTNHILREELSEKNGSASKDILGRKAIERRQQMETSLDDLDGMLASDGKKKDLPLRRKRTKYENMVVDGEI